MKIGIIALGAKPFHIGHSYLINVASRENDIVKLYVSLSDRKRSGEFSVLGSTMERIWRQHIEPMLPKNVSVEYTPPQSPIRKVYEFLGSENEAGSDDTYTIYSDPDDLNANFPTRNLEKYMGNLYVRRQIRLEPISRGENIDISGTQMRQFLSAGDRQSFLSNIPDGIDGNAIWDMLLSQDV